MIETPPIPIQNVFTSISEVETHFNALELVLPGFLLTLQTVGKKEDHLNNAVFNRMTSEEFLKQKGELGKLKFKTDNGGQHSVWINKTKIMVSFSR